MANKKISELATSATSIGGYLPLVIGGVTKKLLVGPAGGLDADTVSGYGIGTSAPTITNINQISGGGKYYGNPVGAPYSAIWVFDVAYKDSSNMVIDAKIIGAAITQYTKVIYGGVDSGWKDIWNSSSDGNGGQPPAPKAQSTTDAAPGRTWPLEFTPSGTTYYANGTTTPDSVNWKYLVFLVRYVSASGILSRLEVGGVIAGNAGINSDTTSTYKYAGFAWRMT